MQATQRSFEEALSKFSQLVPQASFASFDAEFSGVVLSGSPTNSFDTPQQRYTKLIDSTSKFLLIQYGIALFIYDEARQEYRAYPFSFLIFPSGGSFLSDATSLRFLAGHNFDFNTLVRDGIGYTTVKQEEQSQKKLVEKQKDIEAPWDITSAADIKFWTGVTTRVTEWLCDGGRGKLRINAPNTYFRKMVYCNLPREFPCVFVEYVGGSSSDLDLTKCDSPEDKKRADFRKLEDVRNEIVNQRGFRRLLDILFESRVPLVGHNCSVDLLQTLQQFYEAAPPRLVDWKARVREKIPGGILDTKYYLSCPPPSPSSPQRESTENCRTTDRLKRFQRLNALIPITTLGEAFEAVSKSPFADTPRIFVETQGAQQIHDAAYDAYATGCVFLRAFSFLNPDVSAPPFSTGTRGPAGCSELQYVLNKVALSRSSGCIDLGGPDSIPDYSNVYHLRDFAPDTKISEIISWFDRCGKVVVKRIDDRSAFVTIQDKQQVNLAGEIIARSTKCKGDPWNEYARKNGLMEDQSIVRDPHANPPQVLQSVSKMCLLMSVMAFPWVIVSLELW